MAIYVKCKTEDCGNEILAPEYAQTPFEKLEDALHKKNYYLCPKCGLVHPYLKEDHFDK